MAENSSNSSNHSLLHPDNPLVCHLIEKSSLTLTAFSITSILLLLPLCILIIYLGLQRWRQQGSTSAAAAATSHSDSFTYHMVAMELIAVLGCALYCWGFYRNNGNIRHMGYLMCYFTGHGETFFHILTCVERYLAVVHPVTYLSLKGERGIRIRNISIGCVWLLCCIITSVMTVKDVFLLAFLYLTLFSLIITSFCSLSVLCILIRPGPGEQGGDRGRVDQLKRRAFYTILVILGVLLLRFGGNLVIYTVYVSEDASHCVTLPVSQIWFNLPSSLLLPVLFLHKAGTFVCFKKSTK